MENLLVVEWSRTSDRRAKVRFQMPPKTHQVHAVYVLVKFVVRKVPWSVVSNLPLVLSQVKIFLPWVSGISKL